MQTLTVLDISPTLKMFESTDLRFATAYYHWFQMLQPAPLPEKMLQGLVPFNILGRVGRAKPDLSAFSKAALAAVLLAGVPAATGFTPALAQKKDEKAQDLKLSAEFRKPAAEIQKLAEAKDWAGVKAQIDALDAVAKTEDEKFFAANFRLQAAANTNDTPSTITALDQRSTGARQPRSAYQTSTLAAAISTIIRANGKRRLPPPNSSARPSSAAPKPCWLKSVICYPRCANLPTCRTVNTQI